MPSVAGSKGGISVSIKEECIKLRHKKGGGTTVDKKSETQKNGGVKKQRKPT